MLYDEARIQALENEVDNLRQENAQGGENPEVILYNEYRLEPDYIWDLL